VHEFRAGLEFDVAALEHYLAAHIADFRAPSRVRQFPGGQSNPTYRLDTPGASYVLRRKPPGVLLPSAHAIDREYRVMHALALHTGFPVAKPRLLCEDNAVIGTAFYVMDFVDGRILWDPQLPELARDDRRAVFMAMVETLADLHAVDYVAIGLADFGRPEGYVARQIARWSKQYAVDAEVAGRVPAMEQMIEWLPRNAPTAEPAPALVHGDYRLDNMMFHPTEDRVVALLDWELSTLGHPAADLAFQCMQWRLPHGSSALRGLGGVDRLALGIPSEEAYVEAYCRRMGIDGIADWNFCLAVSFFRLASICQGVYKRGLDGNASSNEASRFGEAARRIADAGCSVLD
jgi:aminoglycoside phosphotransferase (APT) family kinase protein